MQSFTAHHVALSVASLATPTSFLALSNALVHVLECRSEHMPKDHYREHAWQRLSDATQHAVSLEAECIWTTSPAMLLIHRSGLEAASLQMKIVMPDASEMVGKFAITRYALVAEEGETLRAEMTLVSQDALTLSLPS